jgi:sugar phosphate isomerase/epimerase
VEIGVLTNSFMNRTVDEIIDWSLEHAPEISAIEIGTGGYEQQRHWDPRVLLADPVAARRTKDTITERGLEICAFNVSGNPLHPDQRLADLYDTDLRATLELAQLMGVERVVAMSGCPGAGPRDSTAPHFVGGGWLIDLEGILDWQWAERVRPYWTRLATDMRRSYPKVKICLELCPGASVYNLETFERLHAEVPEVTVNLDPSHLMWQEADPLAVIHELKGRIGFAHGKDTLVQHRQRDKLGVLDARIPYAPPGELPWVFSTPGDGHDIKWWTSFVEALSDSDYDGPISIEYEDPYRSAEDSVATAARVLGLAVGAGRAEPV